MLQDASNFEKILELLKILNIGVKSRASLMNLICVETLICASFF